MFIKFTRLDGSAIWINSCFVVTVEPRRGGGSIVVPIGDGLDYDVRESPEKVLEMLGQPQPQRKSEPSRPVEAKAPRTGEIQITCSPDPEAPKPEETPAAPAAEAVEPTPEQLQAVEALNMPSVVPVPPPAALPEKFEDVVSAGLSAPQPDEIDSKPVETPAEPPAKPARGKRKPKAETTEGEAKPKKATRTRKTAKKVEPPMDEAQIERLKRMAPGSVKKLQNTLASQFRIEDVEATIKFLLDAKVFKLDQDHVTWTT